MEDRAIAGVAVVFAWGSRETGQQQVRVIPMASQAEAEAQELLLNYSSAKTITDIAMQVGYNDPAYFCKVFKAHTGLSPKTFRKATSIT